MPDGLLKPVDIAGMMSRLSNIASICPAPLMEHPMRMAKKAILANDLPGIYFWCGAITYLVLSAARSTGRRDLILACEGMINALGVGTHPLDAPNGG